MRTNLLGSAILSVLIAISILSIATVYMWSLQSRNINTYNNLKDQNILPKTENTGTGPISKDVAIRIVENIDEVKSFLKTVANGKVATDGENETESVWVVHVYESKSDHNATFNWYEVDKESGKVTKTFNY